MIAKQTHRYNVILELADEEHAQFIVDLRLGERNKHISQTSPDVSKQVEWLRQYKKRESLQQEFYFIVRDANLKPWGTTRLYNFKDGAFEIGSWVFLPGSPEGMAIKADLAARELGFEELGFDKCTFEVRKDNKTVLRYHNQFKPEVVAEDEANYYFNLDKSAFYKQRDKLLKFL